MGVPQPNRALSVAALLSMVAHVALLSIAASSGSTDAGGEVLEPPIRLPEFVLGENESEAVTITWIGFDRATDHSAPRSEVDQPALALGTPGPVGPGASAMTTSPSTPSQAEPNRSPDEDRPAPKSESSESGDPELARASEAEDKPATVAVPTPAKPAAQAGGGGSDSEGEPSDRESSATARDPVMEYTPGKPLARKGLRVRTVRPKFGPTTKFTALRGPNRAPVVQIRFGRDGKVISAIFEKDRQTGIASIDEPILNAAYSWTAQGEDLEALPRNDPEAHVEVSVRFVL